jgi:hypothetical protein
VTLTAGNLLNTAFDGIPRQFERASFLLSVEYPVASWTNKSLPQWIFSNGTNLTSMKLKILRNSARSLKNIIILTSSLVKKMMFSVLKTLHFMPCFAIFFSTENINAENVSLYFVNING